MWFFKKKETTLGDHLRGSKQIILKGIRFEIRKLNPMDYLEGGKVMQEVYATYKTDEEKKIDAKMVKNIEKIKAHMRDVIMAGVVRPELVRKPEDNPVAVCVDEIFADWELAQLLVAEILNHTYGRKKK